MEKELNNKSEDCFEPNFMLNDLFNTEDGNYAKNYDLDTLYSSPFGNGQGKYFSIVTTHEDGQPKDVEAIFAQDRYKIRLTFIKNRNEINEVLITKYRYNRKKEWKMSETEGVRFEYLSFKKIFGFLKFLAGLDLPSIDERKIKFLTDEPEFGEREIKIVKTFFSTKKGRELVDELLKQELLSSDLDIPELIKNGLSKSKIEEKRKIIEQFKIIINNKDVKEVADIQIFLKNNPWLFGPEYKSIDFREAGFAGNPDGRILRIDGLSDILEVKLPSEELLRADDKNRQYISPKLAEALGQLTGYLEYYYSEYSHERNDKTGLEEVEDRFGKYYKPKGILLIGRRGLELVNSVSKTIPAEPKYMRRLLSYFHWIEVITYDDLIERAENGLNNLIR